MLDEHGMPVPVCGRVIVEQFGDEFHLLVDGEDGFQLVLTACKTREAADFFAHAMNHILPCREIVRRMAEIYVTEPTQNFRGQRIFAAARDASQLWVKMQEDAKGGGDGNMA